MKKTFTSIAIFFTLIILPVTSYAHELIPKELKAYMIDNPNATPEDIKKFVDAQDPTYGNKFKNGEAIVDAVRNQQTSILDNMFDFFKIGVGHILSGPDHILFVLSILLIFVSLKSMLKYTAVFTVAHSITLLLAGSGVLVLSSRVVEPFIALSIAYVAITSVFFNNVKFIGKPEGKTSAIFFFGLFHGLGFAGLLRELSIPYDKFLSSLIAFNIGIETGQLIIVSCALPFIYLFRNREWYGKAIKVIAILISILALFWFIQRILPA